MQILTHTNIDFMKHRRFFVWFSLALLVISCVEVFIDGLNLGIDFAGGTQMTVRLKERMEVDDLRRIVEDAGLRDAQLQRFGGDAAKEILIKTPILGESEEGSANQLTEALNGALNRDAPTAFDLNQRGTEALAELLREADPDGLRAGAADPTVLYQDVADAIIRQREEVQLFEDWSQVTAVPGVSQAVLTTLQEQTHLGNFHVLSVENVGPQIGSELRTKGILAVVLSLAAMLVYIWVRFELRFGIGAIIASLHDVLITLGLFSLFGYEFNLSTIAAFLTLVGYSVNDTVVIFDRVRENMRRLRRQDMVETLNQSLNQTLSRTILTSGTTLLAILSLYILGGEVIESFAFVLLVGVIIGTYSTLFVASPFTLMWEQYISRRLERRANKPAPMKTA